MGKSTNEAVSIQDAVIAITGGGRGIGRATALEFARLGAKVAIISRTETELNEVVEASHDLSGQVLSFACDLEDAEQIQKTFRKIRRELGAIRILINNAAFIEPELIENVTLENLNRSLAINVRAVFLCSQEVFSSLKEAGKTGTILNIASLSGIRGTTKFPGFSIYTATKHAVVGLTEAFAEEGKACGIRVNCLAPGAVDTVMLKKAAPTLRTNTKPHDIAKIIVSLCDDTNMRALNGAVVEVNSNA